MRPFDYSAPGQLKEAVTLLTGTPGARLLAGGSHLLVEPNRSQLAAPVLVDLRRVEGLAGIERQKDGSLHVGAMTTIAALAADAAVRDACPVLAEAAAVIGDPQVRNRATLGGSLATNDPAGDLPAVVLALEATVQVTGPKGSRALAADALLTGPFQTALAAGDVLTAVTVPARAPRSGSAYEKIRNPSTFYAVCGVAASVTLKADGSVKSCRVALAGVGASATRQRAVEAALDGQAPTPERIKDAARRATEGVNVRSDRFASTDYRGHLATVLTERALTRALERASG